MMDENYIRDTIPKILEQIDRLQNELDGLRLMVKLLQDHIGGGGTFSREISSPAFPAVNKNSARISGGRTVSRGFNNSTFTAVEEPPPQTEPRFLKYGGNQASPSVRNTPPPAQTSFLDEYNALAGKSSSELRNARKDFLDRYRVRAFSCVNFADRMIDPVPPPRFADAENGEYWAIPLRENMYAVIPNVNIRNYTDNHHSARAMGEVFDSNFRYGGDYRRIRVDKAAVFTCSGNVWTLAQKGKLILE